MLSRCQADSTHSFSVLWIQNFLEVRTRWSRTSGLCCVRVASDRLAEHSTVYYSTAVVQPGVLAQAVPEKECSILIYCSLQVRWTSCRGIVYFGFCMGAGSGSTASSSCNSTEAALPGTQDTVQSWTARVGRYAIFHTTALLFPSSAATQMFSCSTCF